MRGFTSALALTAALCLPGCVTFVSSTRGNPVDPEALATIQRGTPLPKLLATLGAPLEVHQHADGKLLIYRRTGRHTFRLGLDASNVLRFVDTTQLVSEAAGNVQLTIERVNADEDRVVILLDAEERVLALGTRDSLADLPVY